MNHKTNLQGPSSYCKFPLCKVMIFYLLYTIRFCSQTYSCKDPLLYLPLLQKLAQSWIEKNEYWKRNTNLWNSYSSMVVKPKETNFPLGYDETLFLHTKKIPLKHRKGFFFQIGNFSHITVGSIKMILWPIPNKNVNLIYKIHRPHVCLSVCPYVIAHWPHKWHIW